MLVKNHVNCKYIHIQNFFFFYTFTIRHLYTTKNNTTNTNTDNQKSFVKNAFEKIIFKYLRNNLLVKNKYILI